MKRQRAQAILYAAFFALVLLIIIYESLAKGWLLYATVPSLLVALPFLVVVQSKMIRHIRHNEINLFVAGVAVVQLFGALLFYVCLPGVGDSDRINIFGLGVVRQHEALVDAISYLSIVGLVASLVATVTFFVVLREEYRTIGFGKSNRSSKPKDE